MDARAVVDGSDGLATVSPTFVPRSRPDILELDFDDGVILYDPEPSLVHHLNPSAGEIWSRCDGHETVGTIETDLAETYGVPIGEMEDQVRLAISTFESLGLVEEAPIDVSSRRHGPRREYP
jgi:PqqD family protein of HPr-rel-A system